MKNNRIASIIVAAGYSSRMGSFKPFLKFGEATAIEMVVNTYKSSGIDEIIVVTGHNGSEVAESLKALGVQCVLNENYAQGMFSSILKGMEALDINVAAFFMQPVDVPLVKKHTVEVLKNKYLECSKGIIYPNFCGKRGHPPLIACKYKQAILSNDGEGGLKRILDNFLDDSLAVPVFDEAVLMDMDTKEDYEKLLRYYNSGAPNRKECDSILNIYNVPDNIIRHCKEVARVSLEILHRLKSTGLELDEVALEAAAMLHDIAKTDKNHAQVGENIMDELGYGKVGSIIGTHTDIKVVENDKLTENEILYLADKLVKEDKVITLEERFGQSLKIYSDNPEALRKIQNRWAAANKIIKKIEKTTGKGFKYG